MKILIVILLFIIIYMIIYIFKIRSKGIGLDKENIIMTKILDIALNNKSENIIEAIADVLRNYYKLDYCTIFEYSKDNGNLYMLASNVENAYKKKVTEYVNNAYYELKTQADLKTSEGFLEYASARERGIKYSCLIKLDNGVGAILFENKSINKTENFEIDTFKFIIKNITILLQNFLYQHKIKTLAMRDNLTKMFNRNYMQDKINDMINGRESFTMAMFDIDHFKSVNDTYGHKAGDKVLQEVSYITNEMLGPQDDLYRWGGEEFILTFKDQDVNKVYSKLDRIRQAIEKTDIISEGNKINVTISYGITTNNFDSIDDTIKRADTALYHSKKNGRNQITIYNTDMDNVI